MEEIWKDIIGYEGLYQVSDLGRVKSFWFDKERILRQKKDKFGYLSVGLHKEKKQSTKTVHRLVWESFNGKTDLDIDHIVEGNKLDNRLCNLQTLTTRQNITKNKLTIKKSSQYTGVCWHKQKNKWMTQIRTNGKVKYLGYFLTEEAAHLAYKNALANLSENELSLDKPN